MNKLLFLLIISAVAFMTACGPIDKNVEAVAEEKSEVSIEDEKLIEENYVAATEEFFKETQSAIDELNVFLDDSEYVEVNLNTMSLTFSDLPLNKQNDKDTALLQLDSIDTYNKYEETHKYVNEIRSLILSVELDLANAALEYDESIITDVRGKIFKINRLTEEAIEQLSSDRFSQK